MSNASGRPWRAEGPSGGAVLWGPARTSYLGRRAVGRDTTARQIRAGKEPDVWLSFCTWSRAPSCTCAGGGGGEFLRAHTFHLGVGAQCCGRCRCLVRPLCRSWHGQLLQVARWLSVSTGDHDDRRVVHHDDHHAIRPVLGLAGRPLREDQVPGQPDAHDHTRGTGGSLHAGVTRWRAPVRDG